jgi:3',5'-cyclic AMP phosphodiesterase CpdA
VEPDAVHKSLGCEQIQLSWLTDIHLNFVSPREGRDFVDSVASSGADAVLIGGDIADAAVVVEWLQVMDEVLQRPIYFVLGNHDFYGSSIASVRERVAACCHSSQWLTWLDEREAVALTKQTGLIGHSGWADGQYGDYTGSRVQLNDYRLISELAWLDRDTRGAKLAGLGREAADHISRVLPDALGRFQHVVVLTHVPPFREAAWYDGELCDDEWLPHFACRAVGEALLDIARDFPDRRLTVLCGHTHGDGEAQMLPNLRVITGAARYGQPQVQSLIRVD